MFSATQKHPASQRVLLQNGGSNAKPGGIGSFNLGSGSTRRHQRGGNQGSPQHRPGGAWVTGIGPQATWAATAPVGCSAGTTSAWASPTPATTTSGFASAPGNNNIGILSGDSKQGFNLYGWNSGSSGNWGLFNSGTNNIRFVLSGTGNIGIGNSGWKLGLTGDTTLIFAATARASLSQRGNVNRLFNTGRYNTTAASTPKRLQHGRLQPG